ncbi:hypothetical protein EV195_11520 [Tenacibaculum skagerrakense]|uniref:Uncharacterized protein n=1 Tax=Tenacibaculum skagerrakense TaxID=186571 RepID=A0A4R2NK81_9FLAO|nr:hypothetical protein [Tenacibaculum skagerrakense]TCP21907.1 hypothetical protein EV195_11520 [Tenacibaculum skagerrakense]
MIVSQKLEQFYLENDLDQNGGADKDYFTMKFRLFSIKLPNAEFRKSIVHIHDIEHVLFNCDVSWKGEAFIAGWEISTGMWKHVPIGFMSIWAMGFGLLTYPKQTISGYKKGLNYDGLIDKKIPKEKLMNLTIPEINKLLLKPTPKKINYSIFCLWNIISILIVISPILLIILWFVF